MSDKGPYVIVYYGTELSDEEKLKLADGKGDSVEFFFGEGSISESAERIRRMNPRTVHVVGHDFPTAERISLGLTVHLNRAVVGSLREPVA